MTAIDALKWLHKFEQGECDSSQLMAMAQDQLRRALETQAKIDSGELVVVPKEPTEEIIEAMKDSYNYDGLYDETWTKDINSMDGAYQAMIAAAQEKSE